MLEGKVRAALHLPTDCGDSAPLQLNKMIGSKGIFCWRNILWVTLSLQQCAVLPSASSVFDPHPVYFDRITGSLIRSIS